VKSADFGIPLSIVIPLYNEGRDPLEANLENAGRRRECLDRVIGEAELDVHPVDNAARCDSANREAAARRWPPVTRPRLSEPNYGEALKAGIAFGRDKWGLSLRPSSNGPRFIAEAWRNAGSYEVHHGVEARRILPSTIRAPIVASEIGDQLRCSRFPVPSFTGHRYPCPQDDRSRNPWNTIIAACKIDRGQFDLPSGACSACRARPRAFIEVPVPIGKRQHRKLE